MKVRSSALIQLVVQELTKATAVRTLVGDRVMTAYPRSVDIAKIKFPIVVVSAMGGGARYGASIQDMRLAICAFDQTSQAKAMDLYDTMFDNLQSARLISTVTKTGGAKANSAAGYAREAVRPSAGWNEETGAWYSEGTWIVIVAG